METREHPEQPDRATKGAIHQAAPRAAHQSAHEAAHEALHAAVHAANEPADSTQGLSHRHEHVPAWLRKTKGEPRWQMSASLAIAVGLQLIVPSHLAFHPRWVMPAVEGAFLLGITIANPGRINRVSQALRGSTFFVGLVVSFANAWSLVLLIRGLVQGTEGQSAGPLLLVGSAIWGTNVIVFSLWYWEFDRGGPVSRAHARRVHPDLLFPQMISPEYATPDWEPQYFDYLYTSFTNATAFSPTDTMPLSRWTKMLFLVQSAVSLVTAALVIARAVNILK